MLVIRLRRTGKKKKPVYHLVVCEKTAPIQGKFVEKLGLYDPTKTDKKDQLFVNQERIKYWLSKGVKASDTVNNLLVIAEVLPKDKVIKTSSTKKKKEKEEKPEKPAEIQTASQPEEQGENVLEETSKESDTDNPKDVDIQKKEASKDEEAQSEDKNSIDKNSEKKTEEKA